MGFIDFVNKYGVVGLAIGFIIGSASRDLVNALVEDILMSMSTFFIHGGAWKEIEVTVGPVVLSLSHFAWALLDHLIIALIVFHLMKMLKRRSSGSLICCRLLTISVMVFVCMV